MEQQINIVELTKSTAKNLFEMMMELAAHIEKLEVENAELRNKLSAKTNDFK
jgi:hypothetical protein